MAAFSTGWYRFVPFLGYHHVLMLITMTSVIFCCIILAGCSSNNLTSVYLVALKYKTASSAASTAASDPLHLNENLPSIFADQMAAANNTIKQVNVGYFGICILLNTDFWLCSNNAQSLVNNLRNDNKGDPLNMVWMAQRIRSDIFFYGLIIIVIVLSFFYILLLATFPGWHESEDDEGSERDVKPFPSRAVSQVALCAITVAAILILVSALWQHLSSSAAQTLVQSFSYGLIDVQVGGTVMGFGWASLFLSATSMAGILIMVLSIRVLAQLVVED